MATKTIAKKQKGSGKKKQYNKSNRTRCSPSDVAKLLEKLSYEQKTVFQSCFHSIFEENGDRDKSNSEENTRKFKRAFILYIEKTFLYATNSTPLSPKHFLAIVNIDNSKQMNWARHVRSFLLDGITKMRWKNSKGVEGCVFALLIIYLHETHLGEDSEDDEARPPWLSYWRGDTLKERLKLEKKDSTNQIQSEQSLKMTIDPPPQGVAAAIDGVLVTPPDSGIAVVQATSAEEELIRREMSKSITNLMVEKHVDKGVIGQKESVIEELTHRHWESNRLQNCFLMFLCILGTMATKTTAKKQKGSGKKKQYNKSNRTRCSPSDVAKLLEKLSCEQNTVVRDMSFGALENLSILNIIQKMMMELVDCFNTNENSIRTTLGRITLDAISDERKAAVNSFKGASIVSLKKMNTFLCATNSTPLSPKHFLAIVNVDNSKQMNWARHVCSFLLDGITEMRWKNSKGVEGCVFALLIIYLHETHLREESEDDEARPPWLSY
ncbi:hypothetical protein PIB30_034702 [Stylosanthes scabra]|uniref:Uncharacterized protein n=1 Tax=Stylosanthes scabra TaxID=79078 RepID=A0ABU6TD66_9FABA|nr:hypothetical protein [Stylosanthes scabra]